MAAVKISLFLTALCITQWVPSAVAQFEQDYDIGQIQISHESLPISPVDLLDSYPYIPIDVIDLYPQSVLLVYNCFYMTAICRNAYNFANTERGMTLHPTSYVGNKRYGYDLNTGGSTARTSRRRSQSCPGSWKNRHVCPEFDQAPIYRHDGQWWTTDTRGPSDFYILDEPANAQRRSNIRYSCDEFPPATWIEGGNNIDGTGPSETRCAPIRCPRAAGVKAEQNWQASSHGMLRNKLVGAVEDRIAEFPGFDDHNNIIFFDFLTTNMNNGIAAYVFLYDDDEMTQVNSESPITQAKKRSDGGNVTDNWAAHLDFNELRAAIMAANGTESLVLANDSSVSTSELLMGMPNNLANLWDTESKFETEDDILDYHPSAKSVVRESKRQPEAMLQPVFKRTSDPNITPLLKRASPQALEQARKIVQDAINESSKRNKARLANPPRNKYTLKPGTTLAKNRATTVNATTPPPLLTITDEIAEAAALVAEADAVARAGNATKRAVAASGTFWMGSIARKGTVPWGDDPNYKVFRNVLDYGAVGDGVTDDTKAIKMAMTDGKRCGAKCNGSTTKNAIVYFPPGTYLISSTIPMPFGTQVIGDANNRPTLLASSAFIGLGVLSTDEYTGGGVGPDGNDQEYYINTANFYRQIRNLIIDITKTRDSQMVTCLHYQVAQATSVQDLELIAAAGSSQTGIYAENGSGGQISDIVFRGGAAGIYGGTQQFTAQRLTFDGCTTGVQTIWDWGWVWKSITMKNVGVGFKLLSDTGSGNIGSLSIIDSSFTNIGTAAVVISPPTSAPGSGSTGVILEKVSLSGVPVAVQDTSGKTLLSGSSSLIDQWALGPVYEGSTTARSFSQGGKIGNYRRHSTLVDENGLYFERPKPQYQSYSVGDFIHIKDLGVTGDGVTDDTANFQAALYAAQGKILFIDAGSYILTSTVTIPPGSKIVGETWSQIAAYGPYFQDASNPKVMLRVGNPGDIGDVEMQDLIFTTVGPTAGAVLVEWNIKAASPGSAGLWDCHVRIGGATGTKLTPAECPAVTSGIDQGCSAASMMMHLTSTGSGYFENMWLWVADHMIDDPDLNDPNNGLEQNSIYVARGFLIESTEATWLYGTASEHAVFYQYNFHEAANIFAGLLQTESAYFQPSPPPPAPFADVVGKFAGDPDYSCAAGNEFNGCDESWAVIVRESQNIIVASAGIYTWFSSYSQSCIDTHTCQKALVYLDSNYANVRFQNLVTIGAKYMAVMDGKGILALDNLNVDVHPSWSQISILDVSSNGVQFNEVTWIDPKIWDMDQPAFTCKSPCTVKIPPWTGATSTVNYPLLTVSAGTWTSTITKAPLTISEWVFETVTLYDGSNGIEKRQNPPAFYPVPATTPSWPAVVYKGPDGKSTTVAPKVPFPTPPPSIGPGAPPPPQGSWPKRDVQPYYGFEDSPVINLCGFFDFACQDDPLLYGGPIGPFRPGSFPGDEEDDENWEEYLTPCPTETSTSTVTRTTTATTMPEPSPREGDPMKNERHCYNSGAKEYHRNLDTAAIGFCYSLGQSGDILRPGVYTGRSLITDEAAWIDTKLEIMDGCQWTWDYDLCREYLGVGVDSCNCGGVDHKMGGYVTNNCYTWKIDPNDK
ncbi:glycoside hydrolase family 55 protein [Nemania sp. FL0031]|nr:glycoside hydrolase family 55 protein [Nemania sp. FL0031]